MTKLEKLQLFYFPGSSVNIRLQHDPKCRSRSKDTTFRTSRHTNQRIRFLTSIHLKSKTHRETLQHPHQRQIPLDNNNPSRDNDPNSRTVPFLTNLVCSS